MIQCKCPKLNIIFSLALLSMCLFVSSILHASDVDSLVARLSSTQSDTVRIKLLLQISDACDVDDILTYAQQARTLCDRAIADKKQPQRFYINGLGSAINCIGYYYSHKGDLGRALEHYKVALGIFEQLGDKRSAAYQLNNIAFIYVNWGDIPIALEYHYKNLKIQESIRDTPGIAYTLTNIGHVFGSQKDFKNAMDHFTRSLKLFEAIHDKGGIAMMMENIGAIYSAQGERKKALAYYTKCLSLYEELGDEFYIATALGSCGFEYAQAGDDDKAMECFRRSLAIGEKNQIKPTKAYAYTSIARILFRRGNIDSARLYATRALALGKEMGDLYKLRDASGVLKNIYFKLGRYEDAYEMLDFGIKIRDSISNESIRKTAITKKLQYEYDKKELQLKLDSDKKIWQKNLLIFLCLFVALVIAVATLFRARHSKLKTRLERMEMEQQQYRAQMNPQFIFNCLHAIQHYVGQNDVVSANRYLSEFASLMRTTLEYNQNNTIALQQEIDYLNSYLALEQMRLGNKFTYHVGCSANLDIYDTQILPAVVQPFVENAIVYGLSALGTDGRLSVYFDLENNYLVCRVDDNGIGRKASQEIKQSNGGASISKGMELVRKRLEIARALNKTHFSVEVIDKTDGDGQALGTLVILKFPLEV